MADGNIDVVVPRRVAERRALFAEYQKRTDAVAAAKQALQNALNAESEIVEDILTHSGEGPYPWNGDLLTVSKPRGRGTRYTMKGRKKAEIVEM